MTKKIKTHCCVCNRERIWKFLFIERWSKKPIDEDFTGQITSTYCPKDFRIAKKQFKDFFANKEKEKEKEK